MTFNDRSVEIGGTSTLRDVAKRAGVSDATVSRVLNGEVVVAEQTKVRVLSAIADLKYRPNRNAVELSKRRGGSRKRRSRLPDATQIRRALETESKKKARDFKRSESLKADNLRLRRLIKTVLKHLAKWTAEADLIR